jgi:Glu-tRNA(Gln) amidotransferase subunit E-like FAD-binding protein
MGASRRAGGSLVSFLNNAQTNGAPTALRSLDLDALAGRPVEDIFLGLVDYICPEGGSIDDAIARDAFIETIADLSEAGISDIDSLTAAQVQTVLELYATHAIEARICNDIGAKLVQMPADPTAALRVQQQLNDFIRRGVSDAVTRLGTAPQSLTADQTSRFMTDVYQAAFDALETLGDAEDKWPNT